MKEILEEINLFFKTVISMCVASVLIVTIYGGPKLIGHWVHDFLQAVVGR